MFNDSLANCWRNYTVASNMLSSRLTKICIDLLKPSVANGPGSFSLDFVVCANISIRDAILTIFHNACF